MQTNAVIRWRGGAYSALSAWPYSKTKQIIFSAQNSNDIDGRCSESNLVSFLMEKISTSQMLMASTQMLIACWSAYISLAQNKNRWLQKVCRSEKKNRRAGVNSVQNDTCRNAATRHKLVLWDSWIKVDSLFWIFFSCFLFPLEMWMVDFYFHLSDEKWRPSKLAKPNRRFIRSFWWIWIPFM